MHGTHPLQRRRSGEIKFADGNYGDRPQDDFSSSGIQRRTHVNVRDDIDDIEEVSSLDDIIDNVQLLWTATCLQTSMAKTMMAKTTFLKCDGVRDVTLITPGEAFVFALTTSTARGLSQSKTDAARAAALRELLRASLQDMVGMLVSEAVTRRAVAAAYAPMLRLLIRANVIANLQSPLAKKDALAVFFGSRGDSDPAKLWGWLSQDHERVRCFISLL